MNTLKKHIPFLSSLQKSILVGLILGCLLAFIIIFLQPFDTNNFESNYKNLILSGFGGLFFLAFIIHNRIETIIYRRSNQIWTVFNEIISTIVFFTFSGIIIYLYNHRFINGYNYSFKSFALYFVNIILVFIPIFSPIFIYLRKTFGTLIIPKSINIVTIIGENKNEILKLSKENILYIKAVENYIEIFFIDSNQQITSRTFRQTLTKAFQQLPFLVKCHRSYLLNLEHIQNIKGNSQNAKIHLIDFENTIPLSKTYYTQIKNKLSTK